MKIAVFSDIHSNRIALEACFAEAERRKADVWAFLGDYVSDCACPHKTMELLYKAKEKQIREDLENLINEIFKTIYKLNPECGFLI